MYKVFFNQKPIFLTTELVPQTVRTPVLFIKFSSPENIVKALKSKQTDCLYLYHHKEDKLWMHFLKMKSELDVDIQGSLNICAPPCTRNHGRTSWNQ